MSRPTRSPYLELNAKGVFEIRCTEAGRSFRYSTRHRDRGQAEQTLIKFLQRRHGIAAEPGALTAAQILDAYKTEHLLGTVDGRRTASYILPRLMEHFGHLTAATITNEAINAYQPERKRGKAGVVTEQTRRIHLATLGAAYNHAVKLRRITKQQTPHIPMPDRGAPRDRVLQPGEHEAIMLAAATFRVDGRLSRIERFCAIVHNAPYRKMTIVRMTWFQVHWNQGIIDPRVPGARQSRKRKVPVPIADALVPSLRRAFEERTSEYVLDNLQSIDKEWAKVMKLAGCPDVTPHVYRHTWATDFISAGGTFEEAAEMLGNTVAVIRKSYAHLKPDYLRSAVNFRRKPVKLERVK